MGKFWKIAKEMRGNALWDFVKWVWRNGGNIYVVSATVATFLLTSVVGIIKRTPLPLLLICIILSSLFVSAIALWVVGLWRRRQKSIQQREKEGGGISTGLVGRIHHVVFFDGQNDRDGVVVSLEITNRGEPSIVDQWGLVVEVNNSSRAFNASHFPNNFIVWDNDGHPVTLEASEMIYEKLGDTPIAKGSRVSGYLVFVTNGISYEELVSQRPRLKVVFADAFGNDYVAESKAEATHRTLYQPGVKNAFEALVQKESLRARAASVKALKPIEVRDELDRLIRSGEELLSEWQSKSDALKFQRIKSETYDWLRSVTDFVRQYFDIKHIDKLNDYKTTVKAGDRWKFAFALANAGVDPQTKPEAYELGFKV